MFETSTLEIRCHHCVWIIDSRSVKEEALLWICTVCMTRPLQPPCSLSMSQVFSRSGTSWKLLQHKNVTDGPLCEHLCWNDFISNLGWRNAYVVYYSLSLICVTFGQLCLWGKTLPAFFLNASTVEVGGDAIIWLPSWGRLAQPWQPVSAWLDRLFTVLWIIEKRAEKNRTFRSFDLLVLLRHLVANAESNNVTSLCYWSATVPPFFVFYFFVSLLQVTNSEQVSSPSQG